MQLATQRTANPPANPDAVGSGSEKKPARKKKDARAGTIAAIHITWAKIARGMKGDKDELRKKRLDFMSQVLKREVTTSRDVSTAKLGKVLDAMRELERAPLLPGTAGGSPACVAPGARWRNEDAGEPPAVPGEVVHLATEAQVAVINKLFLHLGWTLESIEGFTFQKFKRKSHRLLTPAQANSLTMILLTIAASRAIKQRWLAETGRLVGKVSREMIRAEIPQLKRRLGIDQQHEKSEVRSRKSEDDRDEGDYEEFE